MSSELLKPIEVKLGKCLKLLYDKSINPNLRKIYLIQNCIHYIEPRTFLIEPGSLMHVDVSKNKLESTDVTNVILGKKIDRIDYSHNKIGIL
jgi:hypothetical protein